MEQYALVTGADHGLGMALCANLLRRGYSVIAGRINTEERLLEELQNRFPGQLTIIKLDVGNDESVKTLKGFVESCTPYLDILINNAGILGDIEKKLGDDLDFDEMLRVINVNTLGALRVNNALAHHVLKSPTKLIIDICSEAGSITDCNHDSWFGYCISKAGNNMQSALVHNTMYANGGQVMAIHPGPVKSYLRGHLDTVATITPAQSANGILHQALDVERPITNHPLYIDYNGNTLSY